MKKLANIFLVLLCIFYTLPIFGTVLFSLASTWTDTVLPQGWTIQWYIELFNTPAFQQALSNTLLLSGLSLCIFITITLTVVIIIKFYYPKLDAYLQFLELSPYVIPGVVLAIGIIKVFSSLQVNDMVILIGSYIIVLFPMAYRMLSNRLKYIDIHQMVIATRVLGGSDLYCFVRVIIPSMKNIILAISLISFSGLLAEYTFVNLVIGGRFLTLSQYLFTLKSISTHVGAAANTFVLVFIAVSALIAMFLLRKEKVQ